MVDLLGPREQLSIEQAGLKATQPASIALELRENDHCELANSPNPIVKPTISGEFSSLKAASQFLEAIAASQPDLSCEKVQIRILVETVEREPIDHQWFDRYTVNNDQWQS